MKPIEKIAAAKTPDGSQLLLARHDREYSISVDRQELMTSRQHESELELARLGCASVAGDRNPRVLIGGLGMGYTLRQALDTLAPKAEIVVAELIPEIVRWNREYFGELTGHPLRDPRVTVKTMDVGKVMKDSKKPFGVILLDVDNGPAAFTDSRNERLYSVDGIRDCWNALTARGCLAIWASHVDRPFGKVLEKVGFLVRYFRVPAYRGAKSLSRCVWVASKDSSVYELYERESALREPS